MNTHLENPYLIDFPKIGEPALGYISVAEKANLPFIPKEFIGLISRQKI